MTSGVINSDGVIYNADYKSDLKFVAIAIPFDTGLPLFLEASYKNGSAMYNPVVERGMFFMWLNEDRVSYQSVMGDAGYIPKNTSSSDPARLSDIASIRLNGLSDAGFYSFGISSFDLN